MPWVMTHTQERAPMRYHWWIGAIKVAEVQYYSSRGYGGEWVLRGAGFPPSEWPSMSAAMKEMHRLLNSPPPEGAQP